MLMIYALKPTSSPEHIDQKDITSGSVLLFNGFGLKGGLGSAFLKMFGASPYCHVGLVVRKDQKLYVIEISAKDNRIVMVPFDECVSSYNGHVSIRIMNKEVKGIIENLERYNNVKYDYVKMNIVGINRLFWPLFPRISTQSTTDQKSMICSEVVGRLLENCKVLDFSLFPWSSNELIPKDFMDNSNPRLPFRSGFWLSREIPIK